MSRASTPTKLPLATWARYMGIHPVHFEQVRMDTNPHCSDIYYQYEWQTSDHTSREEIARAIAEAEAKIENVLGYRLAPSWEMDEWRETARPLKAEYVNYYSSDIRGMRQTVRAKWGHLISGGVPAKTVIDAGAAITYTDEDGDGYFETATVSVSTSVLDRNEICIFYPGKDGDDAWEIRPIEVSIASGTATITFRRELVVVPELLEAIMQDTNTGEFLAAEGDDDAHFLTEVDVYRRYNDPQLQAVFLWEPFAGGFCGCAGGCSNCAYSAQTGCLMLRGDPRQSIVGYWPGDWDGDENEFTRVAWNISRQPDIVRLYYYSGWRNKSSRYPSRMDPEWERTVAYMAAALLDRPPCACGKGNWDKWRQDLTLVQGDEDGRPYFRPADGVEDNPFGTRRGEVDAWRKVRPLIIGRSVDL